MEGTEAELLMKRETRVLYGRAPRSLTNEPLPEMEWQMFEEQFLLRGIGDHYFHYRRGEGVTIERGPGADVSEEGLWLNGSVHVAIASLNGLLPIHASAVAVEGQVYAFTGPGGAGKSTLVAALGDHGLPMFCDDTLVLDLSEPDQITCLPGHKRLKLTPSALAMTFAEPKEKVSSTVDKLYALPASGDVRVALPLAQLIFLEEGPDVELEAVSGAARFLKIQDDHYTAHLFAASKQFDRSEQFAHISRLARQISMVRFVRPRDVSRFGQGVTSVLQHLKAIAEEQTGRHLSCAR